MTVPYARRLTVDTQQFNLREDWRGFYVLFGFSPLVWSHPEFPKTAHYTNNDPKVIQADDEMCVSR